MQTKTAPDRNFFLYILVPLFFFFGLSSGYFIWGNDADSNAPAVDSSAQASNEVRRYNIPVDDDPALGPADAPVLIIQFSDYQCVYCRKWHVEVYQRLLEQFPGQIRFVYRDFPLVSIHPEAISSAEAANCADEQNAYWKFHDALFSMNYDLGVDGYNRYAVDLGLNINQFSACLDERRYAAEVQADYEYAANLGVRSTPTFFINGIPLIGAQPYEVFKQLVESELALKEGK